VTAAEQRNQQQDRPGRSGEEPGLLARDITEFFRTLL
jgi:hypothetical protein